MNVRVLVLLVASLPLLIEPAATQAQRRTNADDPVVTRYRNPLLPDVQLADPHVIRHNDLYYLYGTTDTRGYDVYTSRNLVTWQLTGRAFADSRGGLWAPDVFYVAETGTFYLYYTADRRGRSAESFSKEIGVASATSPTGPFVDQGVLVENAIDAHLFRDHDGSLFLYYVDVVGGFRIMCQPMASPLAKQGAAHVAIRPTDAWEQAGTAIVEAPFVLEHGGQYYLMYSGSSAASENYAIGYATATSPAGPFAKFAGNPIAARSRSVIGPGHNSVVEAGDGTLWMVYHQKRTPGTGFGRFLAMDPIAFDNQGVLRTRVTRGVDQPGPPALPGPENPEPR